MNNPESCSITSLANSKLFLMVNSLVVIGFKIGNICLAILQDEVLIADKMGRRGEQWWIKPLWTLQRLYNITNFEPLGFNFYTLYFCIIKLLFFDSDFNKANYSLFKLKGTLFLIYEFNDESTPFLIVAFKSCRSYLWHLDYILVVYHNKEVQKEVKNRNILIYQVE